MRQEVHCKLATSWSPSTDRVLKFACLVWVLSLTFDWQVSTCTKGHQNSKLFISSFRVCARKQSAHRNLPTKSLTASAIRRTSASLDERSLRDLKAEELVLKRQLQQVQKSKEQILGSRRLRIGIVGFGTFGQFLAKTFTKHHDVVATSRSDYTKEAEQLGVLKFFSFSRMADFFGTPLDVCVLAVSIISFESTLTLIQPYVQGLEVLIVDVLSVKEYPRSLMLEHLPEESDILCTHPMFGPDSGGGPHGWSGLNFVYEKVRISTGHARRDVLERFLCIWEQQGCSMVRMCCSIHDRHAADSQFITHLVGRMLGNQQLVPTPIDTKGFESLLGVIRNTNADSFELFYGLYKYNSNSLATIEALRSSFDSTVRSLEESSNFTSHVE